MVVDWTVDPYRPLRGCSKPRKSLGNLDDRSAAVDRWPDSACERRPDSPCLAPIEVGTPGYPMGTVVRGVGFCSSSLLEETAFLLDNRRCQGQFSSQRIADLSFCWGHHFAFCRTPCMAQGMVSVGAPTMSATSSVCHGMFPGPSVTKSFCAYRALICSSSWTLPNEL